MGNGREGGIDEASGSGEGIIIHEAQMALPSVDPEGDAAKTSSKSLGVTVRKEVVIEYEDNR